MMNPTRYACSRLVALLFALLLTGFPAAAIAQETHVVGSPSATALQTASLDLPAMTLTPSDLDAAGYDGLGLTYGGLETLDAAAQIDAEIRGGDTAANDAEYARLLRDAGWQRAHETYFASPRPDNPDEFSLRVWSILTQYADDAGAARAFAVLSDGGEVTKFAVEEIPRSFDNGDGARIDDASLWQYDSIRKATGAPFHALELHLRLGNLTAFLALDDFGDRQPDVAAIQSLAVALLRRIEPVMTNSDPGLSASALRFALPSDIPTYDNYARLDGEAARYYGETTAHAEHRLAKMPDVPDIYVVFQYIPAGSPDEADDVIFRSYIFEFDSADAASAAMNSGTDVVKIADDAPIFGDESVSYFCECGDVAGADGVAPHGYGATIRVGNKLIIFHLVATGGISLPAFRDVAQAQTDCLVGGDCLQPAAIPGSLAPLAGTNRPAADGNTPPTTDDLFPDTIAPKESSR